MPEGIIILQFDEFEGAVPLFKYPEDYEVEDKYLQQINISHNFVSSIMLHRDENINALSYYNEETMKTIILFLTRLEDGQDYYEIVDEIDQTLLKQELSDEEMNEELIRMFKLSFSVFKVREQVMLKLANEVSELKSFEHDIRHRISTLIELSDNYETIILLSLCINERRKKDDLYQDLKEKISREEFDECVDKLIKNNKIKYYNKDNILRITF